MIRYTAKMLPILTHPTSVINRFDTLRSLNNTQTETYMQTQTTTEIERERDTDRQTDRYTNEYSTDLTLSGLWITETCTKTQTGRH